MQWKIKWYVCMCVRGRERKVHLWTTQDNMGMINYIKRQISLTISSNYHQVTLTRFYLRQVVRLCGNVCGSFTIMNNKQHTQKIDRDLHDRALMESFFFPLHFLSDTKQYSNGAQSFGECWINKRPFIIISILLCLYMWEVFKYFKYMPAQVPCSEWSSFRGVMSGKLFPLWVYGFFGKLGVASYTRMKILML